MLQLNQNIFFILQNTKSNVIDELHLTKYIISVLKNNLKYALDDGNLNVKICTIKLKLNTSCYLF